MASCDRRNPNPLARPTSAPPWRAVARSVVLVAWLALLPGCGEGDDALTESTGAGSPAGSGSTGAGATTSGATGDGGGPSGSGADGAGAQGGVAQGGGDASAGGGAQGGSGPILGGPGCGFDAAAFCDTFDAPADARGRAGELDVRYWSGSRIAANGPTGHGPAFPILAATLRPFRETEAGTAQLPACRGGLPDAVFPPNDSLVCDPSEDIQSPHLLMAVASQNYGQTSLRIRRPFDFADRTGTVVFDAEGFHHGLQGWISLDITEDPIGAPSFQAQYNYEGGVLPRNGISFQFHVGCIDQTSVALGAVHLFADYAEEIRASDAPPCVPAEWGKLNHFEVRLSRDRYEVLGTPFSPDGVAFEAPVVLGTGELALPFSRGYVQLTTHNHGSLKYSSGGDAGLNGFTAIDAWNARWDNVGFDGPISAAADEIEVADPLVSGTDDEGRSVVGTGWTLPDESAAAPTAITVDAVDLTGATAAQWVLNAWYCIPCGGDPAAFVLSYRINGHAWHEQPLDPAQAANLSSGGGQGVVAHILDAPLDELVSGTNVIELQTRNVLTSYPPGVANVDLVLQKP